MERLCKSPQEILPHLSERMLWVSGPQPFGHQGLVSWKIIFPQLGEAGRRGEGLGGNVSDGEGEGADEALLACLLLILCNEVFNCSFCPIFKPGCLGFLPLIF